jgi:hypothetical protein
MATTSKNLAALTHSACRVETLLDAWFGAKIIDEQVSRRVSIRHAKCVRHVGS